MWVDGFATASIRAQWNGRPALDAAKKSPEFNAVIVSYQGAGQCIDADNLLCGPLDAMVHAGVLNNDYGIRTFNGSDRLRDKANPRTVIIITGLLSGNFGS